MSTQAAGLRWCTVYLEVVGGEGTDDLRRDAQAWRARQGEAAVQILAAHGFLHQPVSSREKNQRVTTAAIHRARRPLMQRADRNQRVPRWSVLYLCLALTSAKVMEEPYRVSDQCFNTPAVAQVSDSWSSGEAPRRRQVDGEQTRRHGSSGRDRVT